MLTETSRKDRQPSRVLLISARADHGGGPRHILDLLKSLNGSFEFFIAAPKQEPYFTKFVELTRAQFEIPARSFSLRSYFGLRKFIRQHEITLVHSHGRGAGLYSRLLAITTPRIQVVHSFHGVHREPSPSGQVKMWIDRVLSFAPFHPLFVSENEKQEALKFGFVRDGRNFSIANNIVDRSRFKPRESLPFKIGAELRFGTLMRPDSAKGPDLFLKLVQATSKLGAWSCVGITQEELGNYGDVNRSLAITGRVAEPANWLSSLDVYVSTSRTEGLPLGVLEAMAAGCICVLSDIPAHRVFSENGAALLFDPMNPASFITYIDQLRSDAELRARLIASASVMLEKNHSPNSFCKKLIEVYGALRRTETHCPMCGDVGNSTRKRMSFRYLEESSNVYQCTSCETAFLSPQPSATWLSHEYSGYYNRRSSGVQKLEHFRRFFENHDPRRFKKVLEIGGGEGACARALLATSPNAELTVVEAHPDAAKFYSDIPCRLVGSSLEQWLDENRETYDLILMFDVLEHVRDPRKTLKRLSQCLSAGGEIWLSVPNFDSISRRVLGKIWPQYKPEHLFYFSEKGLASTCAAIGLSSIQIVRHHKYLPISYLFNVGAGFGPQLIQRLFAFMRAVVPNAIQKHAITFCLGERLLTARREDLGSTPR